jgi:hypothetical protein
VPLTAGDPAEPRATRPLVMPSPVVSFADEILGQAPEQSKVASYAVSPGSGGSVPSSAQEKR